MPWRTSTRRQDLPSDWGKRTAIVRKRDHERCQWPTALHTEDLPAVLAGTLPWPTGDICGAPNSRDVDHKHSRTDHRIGSLWTLCRTHHNIKTHAEATAARAPLHRPPERHPGIL